MNGEKAIVAGGWWRVDTHEDETRGDQLKGLIAAAG